MKPQEVRTMLQRQLEEAKERRERKIDESCKHEWKKYKQTLPIDHLNFKFNNAYFVLKGCETCHAKVLVDYVLE